ncbi:unnamed protein product [Paramecium octaurelia]|uniref:Uncharacterized protein n=1 Tax=Paramecium octaurelia TaxID=43137 RepID=A0A8S1TVR8_PAROT|nr:unnamed protein product [Paramecium octaurelia]CAD8158005.1 unnamed protein product [Paramecium octaurelia]CAD8158013.1 unnamed protein product [Paramecium octaurelia]
MDDTLVIYPAGFHKCAIITREKSKLLPRIRTLLRIIIVFLTAGVKGEKPALHIYDMMTQKKEIYFYRDAQVKELRSVAFGPMVEIILIAKTNKLFRLKSCRLFIKDLQLPSQFYNLHRQQIIQNIYVLHVNQFLKQRILLYVHQQRQNNSNGRQAINRRLNSFRKKSNNLNQSLCHFASFSSKHLNSN